MSAESSSSLTFGIFVDPFIDGAPLVAIAPAPVALFLLARAFVLAPLSTATGGTFETGDVVGTTASGSSSASSSLNEVEVILLRLDAGTFGISLSPEDEADRDRL